MRYLKIAFLSVMTVSSAAVLTATATASTTLHTSNAVVPPFTETPDSALIQPESETHKTHMLVMKCMTDGQIGLQSRAVVLNIPTAKNGLDTALVSGHGLEKSRECYVQDFNGKSARVEMAVQAPHYKAGTAQDWGLIQFKRLNNNRVVRYTLIPQDPLSVAAQGLSFASARGLPDNQQRCQFISSERNIAPPSGTWLHDCRAIGGQSGSPLSYNVNGEDYLAGIHIGHITLYQYPPEKNLRKRGYFRLIDTAFVAEISAVLDAIHEP